MKTNCPMNKGVISEVDQPIFINFTVGNVDIRLGILISTILREKLAKIYGVFSWCTGCSIKRKIFTNDWLLCVSINGWLLTNYYYQLVTEYHVKHRITNGGCSWNIWCKAFMKRKLISTGQSIIYKCLYYFIIKGAFWN